MRVCLCYTGVSHTDIGFLPVGRFRPLNFMPLFLLPFQTLSDTSLTFPPFSSTHHLHFHSPLAHKRGSNLMASPTDSKLKSPPQAASATSFSLGLASVLTACSKDIDASIFIIPSPVDHSADTVDILHLSFLSRLRRIFGESLPTNQTHAEIAVGSQRLLTT